MAETVRRTSGQTVVNDMEALRQRARELLDAGTVQVIIGYANGSNRRVRPFFARRPEDLERLILDDRCVLNLAVYLRKPEVKALGKAAVIATPPLLRSILQLAAENHYQESEAVFLALDSAGNVLELSSAEQIAGVLGSLPGSTGQDACVPSADRMPALSAGSTDRQARFAFWKQEFERCIRCYACRAACPMCYCEQCLVDSNQPQWIPVAAHSIGNLEWHISRAMHLAGRCVNCGACSEACPAGIPLNLVNQFLADRIQQEFGQKAGTSAKLDYALSVFSGSDRETFIK
ncbi:MAG: hypothetical protein EHM61_13020 [Acidobacteria bacterium]|nr:MAG: hypothetical protein EHM61_13020 [Acidobacteriota bacterium]